MTIDYERTTEDLTALHFFVRNSKEQRRARRVVYVYGLYVAYVPLLVFVVMFVGGDAPLRSYVVLLPPAMVGTLFWTWLYWRMERRQPDYSGRPDCGRHQFFISSEGLGDSGPTGSTKHFWKAVTAIDETADHFFISVAPPACYFVPKRIFQSPEQLAQFKNEIGQYWQSSREAEAAS